MTEYITLPTRITDLSDALAGAPSDEALGTALDVLAWLHGAGHVQRPRMWVVAGMVFAEFAGGQSLHFSSETRPSGRPESHGAYVRRLPPWATEFVARYPASGQAGDVRRVLEEIGGTLT